MHKLSRRILSTLLLSAALLTAGCDAFSSEPTYGGLTIEGFNYTPYNLDRFVITDKYGNKAGGGSMMPGAGEGSLLCCYTLKGTEFTVKWELFDQDKAMKNTKTSKARCTRSSASKCLSLAQTVAVCSRARSSTNW